MRIKAILRAATIPILTLWLGTGAGVGAALLAWGSGAPAAAQNAGDPPGLDRAIAVQEFHTDRLLDIDGVVGTGVGVNARGQAAVVIMTEDLRVTGLARSLDGVPVVVRVTGKFHAINKPDADGNHDHGGGGDGEEVDPTSRFVRPVPIGVSTGNAFSCSAGTIGARVTDGTDVYALSNNHVYALENAAPLDSAVLQPGRFDTNCAADPNDVIGTLDAFVEIVFDDATANTVDAAIALSSTAALGNATPPDGYGEPSWVIVAEAVGQSVQKYGRTTALTKGTITMINATVRVGYNSGIARFFQQIIVQSNKPVIKAGDSGSLLVLDEEPFPRPVGLLFAGNRSGKLAVANPIDLVLDAFGVTIDGH